MGRLCLWETTHGLELCEKRVRISAGLLVLMLRRIREAEVAH